MVGRRRDACFVRGRSVLRGAVHSRGMTDPSSSLRLSAPSDPVAAVTHADPYPYYAGLRAGPPLVFDAALKLWVASRADVVAEALAHPAVRVRPAAEPVPRAIAGGPAGEVFGRLVRMNDGARHAAHRPVLQRALAALESSAVHARAVNVARQLPSIPLDDWLFAMPLCALADLLGFTPDDQLVIAVQARAFVACLSPLSTPAQLAAAHAAAENLQRRIAELWASGDAPAGSLLAALGAQVDGTTDIEPAMLLANLVGLFSQTCDGTAGLIGQGVIALARDAALIDAVRAQADGFGALVREVARHDPPVQNTRRFAADACHVGGVTLQPGDAVLLVLAAANRDPALNPDQPDAFQLDRTQARTLGFGHGTHACPGQALAFTLAATGLQVLIERGLDTQAIGRDGWGYHASVNGRLPRFGNDRRIE